MIGKKIKVQDIVDTLAAAVLLFSSGGNIFVRNIVIFFGISILLLIYTKYIDPKYIITYSLVVAYILLDSLIWNSAPSDIKECIMLAIRLAGCLVIASNISEKRFCLIFVRILAFLSVLSLLCFALIMADIELPGTVVNNGWCGTFYHTLGIGNVTGIATIDRKRNSGIFTEPGIFQLYLNTALLFLMREDIFPARKRRRLFLLFSITIISTMSSMGYIIYILVLLIYYIEKKDIYKTCRSNAASTRIFLISIAGFIMLVLELCVGLIGNYVISTNSYASRHDDTLLTFLIALDYPIFGIGLATDPQTFWDAYYAEYEHLRLYGAYQNAMSCGLGNYLCMGGIPFTCIYIIGIMKSYIQKTAVTSKAAKLGVIIIVILILMEEPLLPTPFFLINFYWKQRRKNAAAKIPAD